ncbi:MAG: alcohol dehydrogenase catalytic domain-containing protein, partial [Acidimicrobiia bacterium]|nr:alcohol dehydrogenase catalytic domain-containing protein [Acidimicrobiia bacterium]
MRRIGCSPRSRRSPPPAPHHCSREPAKLGEVDRGATGAGARALVLESPRRLVPRRFDVPATGEDDGLLRVEACGLCGTDHEQYSGALPAGFAFVPGHEVVG